MSYTYNDETFDRFDEAARRWLGHWGSGGGCATIETTLREIEGATRQEWVDNANGCWLMSELANCEVESVINEIRLGIALGDDIIAKPTRRCGASLLRSSHPEDTPEEKSITLNIDPSLPDVMTISELDDLPAASYTFSSIEHALDFIEMNSGTLFTQVDSEIDNSVLYRQGNAVCNRTGVYAVVVTDCMRDSMQA